MLVRLNQLPARFEMSYYDRDAACRYAQYFAKRHCHDMVRAGIEKNKSFLSFFQHETDDKALDELGVPQAGKFAATEDCTHFISCCIGAHKGTFVRTLPGKTDQFPKPPTPILPGGGINLGQADWGGRAYGIVGAPRLVRYLVAPNTLTQKPLDTSQKAAIVKVLPIPPPVPPSLKDKDPQEYYRQIAARSQKVAPLLEDVIKLEAAGKFVRGDLFAFTDTSDPLDAKHFGIHTGDGKICSHNGDRLDDPFTDVLHDNAVLLHILLPPRPGAKSKKP